MTQAILLIGNDHFKDAENIAPLTGAARDAHRGAALFEQLGFITRVLTHDQLRQGCNWRLELNDLMAQLTQAGDTLGVFIATHGLTVQDGARKDQIFLLHDALMSDISREIYDHGIISLRKLARLTQRSGLQRFFILDACRGHLSPGRKADALQGSQAGVVLRDLRPNRSQAKDGGDSPLVTFNTCADQQVAREIKKQGTGLGFEALRTVISQRQQQGIAVQLNQELAATVGGRMRQLAHEHGLDVPEQDPIVEGPALPLWQPPATIGRPHDPSSSPNLGGTPAPAEADARLLQAAEEFPSEAAWIAVLTAAHSPALQARARQALHALRVEGDLPTDRSPQRKSVHLNAPAFLTICASALGLALLWWGLQNLRPSPLPFGEAASSASLTFSGEPNPVLPAVAAAASSTSLNPETPVLKLGDRDCEVCPKMVLQQGGSFLRGSESGARNEKPVRRVTLSRYWLGESEVTVAQYLACVQAKACDEPVWREARSAFNLVTGSDDYYRTRRADIASHPVVGVSWLNAQQYVAWLNKVGGVGPKYRLPSEAEWEWSARGGGATGGDISTDKPWGEFDEEAKLGAVAWYRGNSGGTLHPVCSRQKLFELCDMHGLVGEWVQDSYARSYKRVLDDGSAEEGTSHGIRVLRGGSWYDGSESLRSATRGSASSTIRMGNLGFRIARTF